MKTILNLVKKGDWAFFCRPEGCLFSHFNSPKPRKISTLLHKREGLSVPSASFWSKTSLRVFTKVVAVVAAHLRMQNIRLAVFLDDCLALNAIQQMPLRDRKRILKLLSQLGFLINSEKSNLEPTQDITYIGGRFQLDKGIVLPTPDRMLKLREVVTNLMGKIVPARQYLQTLSVMASCLELLSCRNNKKRENLEYYFVTCICPKIKLKSGFRMSCSVRQKLFEEATTVVL